MHHNQWRPSTQPPHPRAPRHPLPGGEQAGPKALLSAASSHPAHTDRREWGEGARPADPPRETSTPGPGSFDESFAPHERLPEVLRYTFYTAPRAHDGIAQTQIFQRGTPVGDPLTDSADVPDGYRLHDVFHLSYATLLGWSPVTRALLGRKRRSRPAVDENEDGGRAIVIEEGIAALVFAHAAHHGFFRDPTMPISEALLQVIIEGVAHLEVRTRSAHDWERAIRTGFNLWHQLLEHAGCGTVHADRRRGLMTFEPTVGAAVSHSTVAPTQLPQTPLGATRTERYTPHRLRRAS